ncbi:MAG: GMC family oxidoreductase [Paracoccaceae bacterium]
MSDSFDFIVVGAGSAGCVLANRLSGDGRHSVLLVEAGGGDRHPIFRIPIFAGLAYWYRRSNWGYVTEPQPGLDGRAIKWPRGRVLGGSSTINGMMYMRGTRGDYDRWAEAGCTGWSYADVLPYFIRSEDAPHRAGDPFHGVSGPLRSVRSKGENPLYADFLSAGRAEGAPGRDDFNGARQEGLGFYDFNIRNGRRESSATAFLRPARARRNLTVWTRTHAERIEISAGRATGLTVTRRGVKQVVAARREVILSGGAINSPQLLELSGIGDPAVLKAAGIEPVHALPDVGANLQDHLGVYLTYAAKDPVTLYGLFRPDRAALALARSLLFGTGPFSAVPLEAGGFLKTRAGLAEPDIHITFVPGLNLETTMRGQGRHGYLINFYQLRPESRGTVHIASPDPAAHPRIDPRYLSASADAGVMRDGVRLARRIGENPALSRRRLHDLSPAEADFATDESIDAWVRRGANTIFHPVGTCRMGADKGSVLDPELRVRGVAGLRVADASVMPAIVGGNTSAPSMMIAEKAADMILGRPAPARLDPAG